MGQPRAVEFGVYIPQVGLTFDDLLERVARCERLGFDSFWLFDHLYAPGLPAQPALEGWTAATALLARTARLRIGHLVLDNNLRHPALLGRMASTLQSIAGGRFELGLGSGSYETEHTEGGFPWGSLTERSHRLEEALEILSRMFRGEPATFSGRYYRVQGLPNLPADRPRIHIGGASARFTLPLVARFADVWNVPTYALADWEARQEALDACCVVAGRDPASITRSLEAVLALAPSEAELQSVLERAERRYGDAGWGLHAGGLVGTPGMVADRIRGLRQKGIDLLVFFPADRGNDGMLELFADEVMPRLV